MSNYKIQPIDNYAVGVSDDEIKQHDWYIDSSVYNRLYQMRYPEWGSEHNSCKKVIFTIDKDMRAEGIPMLVLPNKCNECSGDGWVYHSKGGQGGVTKDCPKCNVIKELPNQEEDTETVEEKARRNLIINKWNPEHKDFKILLRIWVAGYKYKATQQNKKWSDTDILNMFDTIGYSLPLNRLERKEYLQKHLQSLQKKKYPESVELVVEEICPNYYGAHLNKDCSCKSGFIKVPIINTDLTVTIYD